MSLREISLKYEYRSDGANLVKDFYTPCLRNATQYWRAVGYFTSNGLALNAAGLAQFLQNNGRMRLVTGRRLMEDDIEAIHNGYDTRNQTSISSPETSFEEVSQDRLALLTWLVAHRHLDIKIAYPLGTDIDNSPAIYHEKIGVFFDNTENAIAFAGSQNETVGGLLSNFESFDVHWSWDTKQRVQQKIDNFTRLWNNKTEKLEVVDFPIAVKRDLLLHQHVYPTDQDQPPPDSPQVIESTASYLPNDLVLREYQSEAIDAWFRNGCRGLWEMATGTGKTITALSALAKLRQERERLFILIVCPYKHLVEQWRQETERFGFKPILAYETSTRWINRFNTDLVRYNWRISDIFCAITTRNTFNRDPMQKLLSKLKCNAVLVADEAHHLGATESRQQLTENFDYRLGLSATPDRWFDDKGTKALKVYFGEIIYEFSLGKAIKEGYLCSYDYHPHLVELTDEELEEYEELSTRISRLYHQTDLDDPNNAFKQLLIRRAMLLNKAENKLLILRKLLVEKTSSLHHALFYCSPGQIDSVIPILTSLGLRVAKFTAKESTSKRQEIIGHVCLRTFTGACGNEVSR